MQDILEEMDRVLQDLSAAVSGLADDSLVHDSDLRNYFYLPGRTLGQTGYGHASASSPTGVALALVAFNNPPISGVTGMAQRSAMLKLNTDAKLYTDALYVVERNTDWGTGTGTTARGFEVLTGGSTTSFVNTTNYGSLMARGMADADEGPLSVYHNAAGLTVATFRLQARASQTGNLGSFFASDGTTLLAGFKVSGAYFLASGAGAGLVYTSDANGVGSWQATGLGAVHALLSASHTDTVAHTAVLGDLIYANATPAWQALAGNSAATQKFLTQTGTGAVSAAPAWFDLFGGTNTWTGQQQHSAPVLIHPDLGGGFSIEADPTSGGLYISFNDNAAGHAIVLGVPAALAADATLDLPTSSGTLLHSSGTLSTGAQARFNTASVGFSFRDQTTTSKALRFVLSTLASANHSLTFNSSAARDWEFQNCAGTVVVVGNEEAAPTTDNLGKVDRTGITAVTAATNLTSATAVVGFYAIHYEMTTTTATGGDGTLTFNVIATGDMGALTVASAANLDLATGNASIRGTIVRYVASGALQYSTSLASGAYTAATTRTALRVRVEYLG